jgi:hypothetical protein
LFIKRPEFVTRKIAELVKAIGPISSGYDLKSLLFNGSLFVRYPDKFIEIAKVAGPLGTSKAFEALLDKDIRNLFLKDPDKLVKLVKAAGGYAIDALNNKDIRNMFIKRPDFVTKKFVEIEKAVGRAAEYDPLMFFKDESIGSLFVKHPDKFVKIAALAKERTSSAFSALSQSPISTYFTEHVSGKRSFESLGTALFAVDDIAIEVGGPIDDLHDNARKRRKYLNSLSELKIIGLLLSNPEYFYTSSNHMLIDKMQRMLKDKGKTMASLLKEYKLLNTQECRNLIFRLINYDRLYGRKNSLFTKQDINETLDVLVAPIQKTKFNKIYYFVLANAVEKISKISRVKSRLKDETEKRLRVLALKKQIGDNLKIQRGLKYILYGLDKKTTMLSAYEKTKFAKINKPAVFDPKWYGKRGKLQIVQIFDKEDTKKDHWLLSQRWFWRKTPLSRKPKRGIKEGSELIYRLRNANVALFMGEDEENVNYIKQKLDENPNLIITFRGHSYSLTNNFPYKIFGNKKSNILFIPGSCGSAGSTAEYISANPKTNLDFFSNTSTGKGQVTNAIIDALIKTRRPKTFDKILRQNARSITRNGGDIKTIKVKMPGEDLVRYIESD